MRLQHRSGCARRLRTPLVMWLGLRAGLLNFGGAALLYWLLYPASSQELHQHTHDGDVGHFYQTWMRPGDFGLGIPHRKTRGDSETHEQICWAVDNGSVKAFEIRLAHQRKVVIFAAIKESKDASNEYCVHVRR
jgi:hypothetical protein